MYYSTHHSESIIQWLFFGILLLSALVIARSVFAKKEAEATASANVNTAVFADGSEIETFLKKILDQTTKLESVKLEGLAPAAAGNMDAQVQALKKDLQTREEELAKLKAAGSAPAAAASAETDKLSVRIKELETKLAEYEILEDDIADLSLYKEENVRLRNELDKVKAGGPAAAPGAAAELPKTGDPMADFESAVNLEKKMTGGAAEAQAPAPTPAPAPEPPKAAPPPPPAEPMFKTNSAPAASAPASADSEGDDLFAEFETASPESLDTDKMMEEMAALVSAEPGQGTALSDEIDTEKMAAEATRLTKS